MKVGGRELIAVLVIAALAIGGAIAAEVTLAEELEVVRGVRVTLLARAALGGSVRPEGELTIVKETESAKYPFLNKKRYVVNTASVARAGSALLGTDDDDKSRADRHAEARRKTSLRERLPSGAWRATVADQTTTAELTVTPPPIERGSPFESALFALLIGLAAFVVVHLVAARVFRAAPGEHARTGAELAEAARTRAGARGEIADAARTGAELAEAARTRAGARGEIADAAPTGAELAEAARTRAGARGEIADAARTGAELAEAARTRAGARGEIADAARTGAEARAPNLATPANTFGESSAKLPRDAQRPALLVAALTGVVATAIASIVLLEQLFAAASAAATSYLAAAVTSPPLVDIPVTALRAWIIALSLLAAAITALALSERGLNLGHQVARDRHAYLALAPAMLGMAILVGIPFAYGIGLSLFEHVHGTFTFVGLQNFARIFSPPDRPLFAPGSMLYALVINVLWTAANVTLHVLVGLALALLLQNRAAKLSKLYRVFLIIPWAVPAYLTALIWKSMFDPDIGAINRFLGLEGMSWMHSAPTAFLANLATNVWLGFPFMMVVSLGALTSIPKDLYEAAEVDGASATAQLFRITLPLLQPALLPAIILGSIWTFNRFEIIYLVSEGRPDGATDILVTEAYRWAFERGLAQGGAYGYAAAYSVVIFAVLLVYGWMTSRVAKAAEEALR